MNKANIRFIVFGLLFVALFSFVEYLFKATPPEIVPPTHKKYSYIPQFVVFSFDGSKSIETWESTRAFAKEMAASSTPIHFTYFINATYFLTNDKAEHYQAPRHELGQSAIGYSEDVEHIRKRISEINNALLEGHEIGSHAAGHFMGGDWTITEWEKEFESFNHLLFEIDEHYPNEHLPQLNFTKKDIIGFRAPGLSINDNAYQVLSQKHFRYDASGISTGDKWPEKDSRGLWHYPLGTIFLGTSRHPVIAMDYNIWTHQMDGMSHITIEKNTPEWKHDFEDVVSGYTEYFEKNYKTNRAPVIIGHHFSGWNENLYWEAMKTFARATCGKPQVKCVSFRELTEYLDEYGVPELVKKP